MQHILDETEYQEYLRLKKQDSSNFKHQLNIKHESETEKAINKVLAENKEITTEIFCDSMFGVFNLMKQELTQKETDRAISFSHFNP
jgi:hypothetical protein